MTFIRSTLFNIFHSLWTVCFLTLCLPLLLGPPNASLWVGRVWTQVSFIALKVICGLDYEVRGRENFPDGPYIVAAKHQSAWDTMVCSQLFRRPSFVLKRELIFIPLFGWFVQRARVVAIDRKGGAKALKKMVAEAKPLVADGRNLIVYPEGTRTKPGANSPYHPGIAALYTQLGVPLVPMALNSGCFWARNAYLKHPGRIVVEILPPIPPGLSRKEVMPRLQEAIETASLKLFEEARAKK